MKHERTVANLSRREFLLTTAGFGLALGLGNIPLLVEAAVRRGDSLQTLVNGYIQTQRRLGRVSRDERTAWSIFDFTSGKKLVAINEDRPLQAASMIKPFVAQAYFFRHRENRGRYPYNDKVKLMMTAMLRDSSNSATNFLIDSISNKPARQRPREVERVLKAKTSGIFRQTSIIEYIPRNGRAYRNKASAHDYSRFLFALWKSRLPFAEELKRYMALPNSDRIKRGADAVPSLTKVYDKTGSTARLCGNMGILAARGRNGKVYPYTFIGIIEKSKRANGYGRWISQRSDVMREISSLVYQYMKQHHNLV